MKVSRNEMNTALMRAYEGAAYAIGDYEEAAEMVTWSEMCGLGGFAETGFPPPSPQPDLLPQLDYENNGVAVIDAKATDVCQYGSLATQLACALATREGLASVHLVNCSNAKLILALLAKIARKGFYLNVYWKQGGNQHGASFDSGSSYPDYWVSTQADCDSSNSLSCITILCTQQGGLLANAFRQPVYHREEDLKVTSSALLASRYEQALNHGITVDPDHWADLNLAAWPILVAASDKSSLGAGPG